MNRKLTAMNKLLMEENDRLQKQVSHLVHENGYFRQQMQTVSVIDLFYHLILGSVGYGLKHLVYWFVCVRLGCVSDHRHEL